MLTYFIQKFIMKNYVISLATATDRRQHITAEFGKQGIVFEFFDAITPPYIDDIATRFGIDISKMNLSSGEIACFLSHLCLWQKAIDDDLDWIAIFEDDVYLGDDAQAFLMYDDWLPDDFDVIKLETFAVPVHLSSPTTAQDRQLYTLNTAHYGAGGYIISKQCIVALFELIKYQSQHQTQINAIDDILFAQILNKKTVLQLTPALCIQEFIHKQGNLSLKSTLDEHRQTHHFKKPNRTLPQKIMRELNNLIHKARLKIFGQVVEFK